MNVIDRYPQILLIFETTIMSVYEENPDLRDPSVIAALEKLVTYYTRLKKRLPMLPVVLPKPSMASFEAVKEYCEILRVGKMDDGKEGEPLPLPVMIACLERILDSARYWHKESGQLGYLNYVRGFLGK